jgi:hypothetical protein
MVGMADRPVPCGPNRDSDWPCRPRPDRELLSSAEPLLPGLGLMRPLVTACAVTHMHHRMCGALSLVTARVGHPAGPARYDRAGPNSPHGPGMHKLPLWD